jgi:hypothetical protein
MSENMTNKCVLVSSVLGKPKFVDTLKIPSVLGKRKFGETFDIEIFDDERYGQHISSAFFQNAVGHNVHYEKK